MIGAMTYNNLVQLYFDRSNALQWYWTLYVVIIGGLLAFSSLRQRGDMLTTILITVLFSFFAYKNLGAIQESSLQRFAALKSIKEFPLTNADAKREVAHAKARVAVPVGVDRWPAGPRR